MSGVVLAGGASRRMGREKAFVTVGGETFLRRTVGVLRRAGADPVLVASGTAGRLGDLAGLEAVDGEVPDDDRFRGDGPLAGLLAALRAPATTHEHLAVLAVDLVDGSPDLLRWLRAQWRRGDVALVPADAVGRPQPLHAVVGRGLAPALEAALTAGERRVVRVFEAAGARTLAPPAHLADATLGWSANHNTSTGIDPTPGGLGRA